MNAEKWHHSEICIAINDESLGSIAKNWRCDELLYYTFIIHSAGERIFKIGEHLAKSRAKSLTMSYTPFTLHFGHQRCRSCQISWITCVLQTDTVIKRCYVNRQINVELIIKKYQTSSDLLTDSLMLSVTDWQSDAVSDRLTADYVRHFAATGFLCCGSCVQWVMGFFIRPM